MKIKTNIFTFSMLLLVAFGNVQAQSVDTLISEALSNNPALKSLELKTKSAGLRALSADSYPAPSLLVEFSGIPFGKYNLINDAFENRLSLSQMFMLGGKVAAMTEAEKKSASVIADNYGIYRIKLIADIKMSYYKLWMIQKKIEVQERNIALYNDLLRLLNTSYSVSRTGAADILSIRSEIASGNTQLVALKREFESESAQMNKLLGRDLSSAPVSVASDLPKDTLNVSFEALGQRLGESNPSLKQMNSMADMNRAMLKANSREKIPDMMLQFMVMRQPQGMYLTTKTDLDMLQMETPMTEYMYSVMASFTLPFAPWSAKKYKAREEELYAGIKGIEFEKSDMQRDMLSQLRSAYNRYKTSADQSNLYSTEVIPLYEQAARAQLSAWQNNNTPVTVVIESYRMLLMQQMNYYMAESDIRMALAEIEMMTGNEK